MEIFEFQNLMLKNECPKFLIFLGEDYALANMYIDAVAKYDDAKKLVFENIQTVLAESQGNALFNEKRVFVIKYPKELISREELWKDIDENLGDNRLIVTFSEIDKRTKFYNTFKDRVVNFAPQDEKVFVDMVKENTKMSSNNIKELGQICKFNYGKTLLEIDKIKQYASLRNLTEDEAFKKLVEKGTIYTGNKEVIFEFINRVMEARKDMYEFYTILKKQGESNIKLVSLLYMAFRNQFIVQTVSSPNQSSTGLTPFIINNCLRRKNVYSVADLLRGMNLLREIEQGVKSGRFDEPKIIDYFLSELLL